MLFILGLGMGLLSMACSKTEKLSKLSKMEISPEVKLHGKVCTQMPTGLSSLHKFVFVIDASYSMWGLDPGPMARRVRGLQNLIEKFRDDDNFMISLAVIHNNAVNFLPGIDQGPGVVPAFEGGGCRFFKPRIPADYSALTTSISQLDTITTQAQGDTPFETVFSRVSECVRTGIELDNSAEYGMIVVSDNAPTDITALRAEELSRSFVSLGRITGGGAGVMSRVNLFLYFMEDFNNNVDASIMIHNMILASHGAGGIRSRSVVNPLNAPVDYEELSIFKRPRFVLKDFTVTNTTLLAGRDGYFTSDSDGDGLSDELENTLRYDPAKFSTFGGCSDKIRHENGSRCPSVCMAGTEYVDTDHDGLSDCDEINLGTSPYDFDVDNDGIADGLEVRIGSNPLSLLDRDLDTDEDGVTTFGEAKRQTNIGVNDASIAHSSTTEITVDRIADEGNESCYRIYVGGVPLMNTLRVNDFTLGDQKHESSDNVIKLMFTQVSEENLSAKPSLLYGYKTVSPGTTQVPDVEIGNTDFQLYLPATR